MGGGRRYHGGEYRLSFHHTHNAMTLMDERGAQRWVDLMVSTLDDAELDLTDDARVRPAINTFLAHFMSKYADEFGFSDDRVFGVTNAPVRRRLNLLNMTSDAIESLSQDELTEALLARNVDVARYASKEQLVNKALSL